MLLVLGINLYSLYRTWAPAVIFNFLHNEECYILHFYGNLTRVCYFNWPGSEVGYFYSENGLIVTFLTTLENHNPKCPALLY